MDPTTPLLQHATADNELARYPINGTSSPPNLRKSAKSWTHIVVAALGMGAGIGGSAFGFHFRNNHTGLWGIPTGSVGGILLYIAVLNKANMVDSWFSPKILGGIVKIAMLFVLVGSISFVIYISVAMLNHRGTMYSNSFYYAVIENAVTILIGIYLAIFTWRLKVKMEREHAASLGGVRQYPDGDE